MSISSSPNMALPIPTVGQEAGPQYATDVNNSLTIIDQHDHTPGSGVKITPLALNINTALTFATNPATNVAYVNLTPQSSTPLPNTIYESGVDLYYRDGNGTAIQITALGGIAGTPGSIANLTPPASATYVAGSQTFVFQSNTNIAANLDVGSVLLRNLSPNSTYALTLSPPAAMAANYTITLPTLPASAAFVTIDNSGTLSSATPFALGITATNLASNAVTTAKILDANVTTAKIADGAVTSAKLSYLPKLTAVSFTSSGSWVVPANITKIVLYGVGGGGGGGAGYVTGDPGGTQVTTGGGGGAGASVTTTTMTVTPAETLTITIGAAGAAGANISGPGNPGGVGGSTVVSGVSGSVTLLGGLGGSGGGLSSAGVGGGFLNNTFVSAAGGNGGASMTAGSASASSIRGAAGSGAAFGPGPGGGGGGGGGASLTVGATGGGGAGTVGAGSQPAQNGVSGLPNTGCGGGGGGGAAGGPGGAGGAGGTGYLEIIYVPLV